MGKVKIMAKYRLVGHSFVLFLVFALIILSLVLLGDFSFIAKLLIKNAGLFFSSAAAELSVKAALSVIGILLFLLIISPLRLGCERWFLKTAKAEKAAKDEFFFYFSPKGLMKSIGAFLFCFVRKTAALLLFMFPSLCLSGVLYFSFTEGEISLYIAAALLVFAVILFVTGFVFYFIYTARYFAFYSIIVSNDKIKPQSAFDKSCEITEGAYRRICLFRLSFLPWAFLCFLIVPSFYVWGYYKESKAMLCYHNDYLHS